MKFTLLIAFTAISLVCSGQLTDIFIEAESFTDKGGWVIDQQFMYQMGSPWIFCLILFINS